MLIQLWMKPLHSTSYVLPWCNLWLLDAQIEPTLASMEAVKLRLLVPNSDIIKVGSKIMC